jgi:hypothetical protein
MVPIRKKPAPGDHKSSLKIFLVKLFLARCPCAFLPGLKIRKCPERGLACYSETIETDDTARLEHQTKRIFFLINFIPPLTKIKSTITIE